jgi:hypothetical protein
MMMRGRWLFVAIPIWIVVSAAITYGLVFWTPWFKDDGGYWVVTTATPIYDGSYDFYPLAAQELSKRQPDEVQALVKELWKDLVRSDDAELYILKSLDNVCLGEIDCRGIPSKDVKPFVEAALAAKQTIETATIAWRGLYVAAGSLFVAFLSMGFAGLTFVTRKKPA